MQEREASLMIGAVCGRLARHHPDVPLLTVHDSILTTPSHVDLVHRVITEEFGRLGVPVKLRAEP
jgi:hypothetical protein